MSVNYTNQSIAQISIDKNISDYYIKFLEAKDVSTFDSLTELSDITNRNLYVLGSIISETGTAIENLIRFYNQVDEQLAIPIKDRIPIKIWINSEGGSLEAAFTTCDTIQLSKTPVITINQGCAASAAALIFLVGHKRITFPKAYFLIHEGSIGVNQIDAHKFQSMSDFYKLQRKLLKEIVLTHTKMTEEQYSDHSKDDWWINAEEALDLHIADEIMEQETYLAL